MRADQGGRNPRGVMQKQRLNLSISICITLVLVGVLLVISRPFLHKVRIVKKLCSAVGSFNPALEYAGLAI